MSKEPSRGGERQGRRESIEETAYRKRVHYEQTGNGKMSQEQAVRAVRDAYLKEQRKQGKE